MAGEKLCYVRGDDWEGLYIDGKLHEEGHNIDWPQVLKDLGIDISTIFCDLEWLEQRGRLPYELEKVEED